MTLTSTNRTMRWVIGGLIALNAAWGAPVFAASNGTTSNPHCTTGPAASASTAGVVPQDVFVPDIKLPGLFGTEVIDDNLMGKYFRALFVYMVYAVGMLSVVMVTYGGIKWVAAAGDAGRISDAKDTVTNSIIGLIIALTTYLLLNIINPALLSLNLPSTNTVNPAYFTGAHVIGVCGTQDQSTSFLQCGQMKQIGTETCPDGKTYQTFCIATTCADNQICGLKQNPVTKFYLPGVGCISGNAPVVGGSNQAVTSADKKVPFPTMKIDNQVSCAAVNRDYHLGSNCGISTNNSDKSNSCYMLGDVVHFPTTEVSAGTSADNLHCPLHDATDIPSFTGANATAVCTTKAQNNSSSTDPAWTCGTVHKTSANGYCIATGCDGGHGDGTAICSLYKNGNVYTQGAGCITPPLTAHYVNPSTGTIAETKKSSGDALSKVGLSFNNPGVLDNNYNLGRDCPTVISPYVYAYVVTTGGAPYAAFSTEVVGPGSQATNFGCPAKQ